ncbi:MAG: hypothetical protein GXP43_02910 [bacterium]|nr:hypothetical protein [bacterium]
MRLKIFWLVLILIGFFLNPINLWAAEKTPFDSLYQNTYTVLPNGMTKVEHQVRLINKVATIYVTEYSLSISHTNIKNIKIVYKNKVLKPTIKKNDNQIKISFSFPDQIMGIKKERKFVISYIDEDVAERNGRVWEINIPTLKNIEKTSQYSVRLIIPDTFPPLLSSSPKSKFGKLVWQKSDLLEENGVKLIFGDYQSLEFQLNYFIKNKTSKSVYYEVALPPDTDYQKVVYGNIVPKPLNVKVDKDGNWLAVYYLDPNQGLKIQATGTAWLFLKPWFRVSSFWSSDLKSWLQPQDVWSINDPDIKELADSFQSIRQAYRYVVDRLDYSYKRALDGPDRMGAIGALKNPDLAVCMEYTDLFIALARAMGVPAREVNGYAYTANSVLKPLSLSADVLHAWPEYYDFNQKRWRPVDPTWEDTTGGLDYFYNFDLNHFAFVMHGLNPYYPLTPGAYKNADNPQKDVKVTFKSIDVQKKNLIPQVKVGENITSGLLDLLLNLSVFKIKVDFNNPYGEAIYLTGVSFDFGSGSLFQVKKGLPSSFILPPFSQRDYEIILQSNFNLLKDPLRLFHQSRGQVPYLVSFDQTQQAGVINVGVDLVWWFWGAAALGLFLVVGLILVLGWKKLKRTRL